MGLGDPTAALVGLVRGVAGLHGVARCVACVDPRDLPPENPQVSFGRVNTYNMLRQQRRINHRNCCEFCEEVEGIPDMNGVLEIITCEDCGIRVHSTCPCAGPREYGPKWRCTNCWLEVHFADQRRRLADPRP